MKRLLALITSLLIASASIAQQPDYKELMDDPTVNFYDVVRAAEAHFAKIDKSAKGSGWKGFARWVAANEYKFYPSGDRSNVDPFFTTKAYQTFLSNNGGLPQLSSFTAGWNELGPATIDSITGHYSAGLGRLEDVYVDPANSNLIYIGSRSGGFWKTNDGGNTWAGTTDYLFATGVNAIAVSPTNPDSVLINIRNAQNGTSHGLYRSADGGSSWTISNFEPTAVGFGGLGTNFKIYEVAYHPLVANTVFVGTNKGIYRSTDNLATWTRLLNSAEITEIEFHPTNASIVYLTDTRSSNGNRDYVYRSTDGGASYSLSNQVPGNNNKSARISVSPACASCLYFASTDGVWRSTDEGQNFTFLSTPSESCNGFAVSDVDTTVMVYGYLNLETSSDGGQSFSQASNWYLGSSSHGSGTLQQKFDNTSFYVHADLRKARSVNGVLYVCTDGYLAKSSDSGNTWQLLSEGVPTRENYRLGISQSNHFRTMIGSQDNGSSIATEQGWVEFYGADGMEGIIHPLNDDWMMSSVQYGSRRRTLNGGLTQSSANPPGQGGEGDWIAPLTYDPNHHMRVYNFTDSIFVSEDFASSWTYRGVPAGFSGAIDLAEIAQNNSDIMVITRSSNIEKSTDGGASFTDIGGGLPNYSITDIAFDPNDDDVIIATFARYQNDNSKVWITTDGGSTWSNITSNLGNLPIRSVVIDHTDSSNIYLGAEIGVYTKSMNGTTWSLYNPNLPNMSVRELEINFGSNTLKAATWGRGLWEYGLVDRLDYPAVTYTTITDVPTTTTPAANINQFVTSEISYDNTLTSVWCEWSVGSPTFGNAIAMSNTSDSTWLSDTYLPNVAPGTDLYFKVFAVGSNNDTTETYKFMYNAQAAVPDVTPPVAICQNDTIFLNAAGMASITASDIDGGSFDNSGTPTLAASATSFTCANLGNNTVTITVTDSVGLTDNCTATVTVLDTLAPTAVCQAATVYLNSSGVATISPASINNSSSDNCSTPTLSIAPATLNCGNTGVNSVTLYATDASGLIDSCSASVTVMDTLAPTMVCQNATVYVDSSGTAALSVAMVDNGSSDNCGTPTLSLSSTALSCAAPGTQTVQLYGVDSAGNTDSCTATITVLDTIAPTIANCPGNQSIPTNSAGCMATATWNLPTASDNCQGAVLTSTHNSGDAFPQGTTSVSYTAVDSAGNSAGCTFDITITNSLLVVLDSVSDAACFDSLSGQAFITASGGMPTYTYDWDHDGTGDLDDAANQSGLGAGTYNLSVTDANGCVATTAATIAAPAALSVTVDSTIAPSVCGSSDGSIYVTTTGGTTNYTYDWSNDGVGDNDDPEDLTGIVSGMYWLTVTDANGCIATTSALINSFSAPNASVWLVTDVPCNGDSSGGISVVVQGGTAPFVYDWDNDGTGDNDDQASLSNVPAGSYHLTVTDANGCLDVASATVGSAPAILFTATTTDALCNGEASGTATILASGGTGTLTEDWALDPTALPAGMHSYSVTDSNGCAVSGTVTIGEPPVIAITTTAAPEQDAIGGTIDLTVSGGTPAYTFDWDNDGLGDADDTEDLADLAGNETYTVIIEDANGCIDSISTAVGSTVGIALVSSSAFNVFPNPNQGAFTIVLNEQNSKPNSAAVVNALGQQIHYREFSGQRISIQLGTVASGIYLLQVWDGASLQQQKIIVE